MEPTRYSASKSRNDGFRAVELNVTAGKPSLLGALRKR